MMRSRAGLAATALGSQPAFDFVCFTKKPVAGYRWVPYGPLLWVPNGTILRWVHHACRDLFHATSPRRLLDSSGTLACASDPWCHIPCGAVDVAGRPRRRAASPAGAAAM